MLVDRRLRSEVEQREHQRGLLQQHFELDIPTTRSRQRCPLRSRHRRPFHEEEIAHSAVGIAFHDHGAIDQVRQQN